LAALTGIIAELPRPTLIGASFGQMHDQVLSTIA
jgi:hypothetical protein